MGSEVMSSDTMHRCAWRPELEKEMEYFEQYIKVCRAHVKMLNKQGIFDKTTEEKLIDALDGIQKNGDKLEKDAKLDSQIYKLLSEEAGPVAAGYMRIGCSQLDKSATADRLKTREYIIEVFNRVLDFAEMLCKHADTERNIMLPGYMHFQHTQPTTLGQYYLRFIYRFERDMQRLRLCYEHTNLCPLGGVAGSGTAWNIDRRESARLLGMDGIIVNAMDCCMVGDDYTAETAMAFALITQTLSKIAADIFEWCSYEFRIAEVSDSLAGSSTLMPQKKNPTAFEAVRAFCGQGNGWVASIMGALKTGNSGDLDLFYGGNRISDAADITIRALKLMQPSIDTLEIYTNRMSDFALNDWSTSIALVDEMVSRGWSHADAFKTVSEFVSWANDSQISPLDASIEKLDEIAISLYGIKTGFTHQDLVLLLNARTYIMKFKSEGSAHPNRIEEQLNNVIKLLAGHRAWVENAVQHMLIADQMLYAK
ncbi:lyase family protein [Petroclostridium sp. X23]|uniref:lyase family protein n=1 Tax=Petroclostridium sp. X23 TaxID=3045146 RepID=UPI0024ACFED6|nr:lyase family protein [Petroclostridium sp. X23]WHH60923.1 lyase family protein [Petroclostridium sp. X23]